MCPGLAEAMPKISKDGKTYQLTLRKGLKYSDGSPVKASDFEHAVKRVLNLESGGSAFFLGIDGAQDYVDAGKCDGDIKGITADDKTGDITIKLDEPDGSFYERAGDVVRRSRARRHALQEPDRAPAARASGPYKVTESVPNRQFVLEKNKNWPTCRISRRVTWTRSP